MASVLKPRIKVLSTLKVILLVFHMLDKMLFWKLRHLKYISSETLVLEYIHSVHTLAATCGFSPEMLISQNPSSLFRCLTFCFVLSSPHFSPSSSCQFASSDDILLIDLLSISLSVFGRDLRCLMLSLCLFSCFSP